MEQTPVAAFRDVSQWFPARRRARGRKARPARAVLTVLVLARPPTNPAAGAVGGFENHLRLEALFVLTSPEWMLPTEAACPSPQRRLQF